MKTFKIIEGILKSLPEGADFYGVGVTCALSNAAIDPEVDRHNETRRILGCVGDAVRPHLSVLGGLFQDALRRGYHSPPEDNSFFWERTQNVFEYIAPVMSRAGISIEAGRDFFRSIVRELREVACSRLNPYAS